MTRLEAPHASIGGRAKALIGLVAGFVVLLLLFPSGVLTSYPPICITRVGHIQPFFSVLSFDVYCGVGFALAAGAATSVAVWTVFWFVDRRR